MNEAGEEEEEDEAEEEGRGTASVCLVREDCCCCQLARAGETWEWVGGEQGEEGEGVSAQTNVTRACASL